MNIIRSILFVMLFVQCGKEAKEPAHTTVKNSIASETDNAVKNIKELVYDFKIIAVDSARYTALEKKFLVKQDSIPELYDFTTIENLLKGKVFFNKDTTDIKYIDKIVFSNGSERIMGPDNGIFLSYFPTENIIFLEGGHTADVTYNISTGDSTEVAGNPEYILYSPNKKFRLNGYFDGQECVRYFIQDKQSGIYKKIFSINENQDDPRLPKFFCNMENHFWSDDTTLNFYIVRYNKRYKQGKKDFYQIKIIGKQV